MSESIYNTAPSADATAPRPAEHPPLWVARATVLWAHRRLLARIAGISLLVSLTIAFTIPKQYKSAARIMPPDQQSSGAMMLAALASRSSGLNPLGALAGGLLGGHSTTALFTDLLRSGTVSGHLIERFNLQHVYHKRYRIDTAKHLARMTKVSDDKKSGVITIEVEDTDPARARDLTQAYLDELNQLVTRTNNSTAHRERLFIEQRLHSVQHDLEEAQLRLSDFSSRNSTVDIKEQTRAMVDVGARIQGELLVQQSGLQSLRQIYGDDNVRVRQSEARIAALQRQLTTMAAPAGPFSAEETGSASASVPNGDSSATALDTAQLYPRLRQLPRLAVPYADLYRRVKVQETVFELLTQQYEMARIEEAKDVPVVSVIDAPGIAEKKSFPPRLLLTLALTTVSLAITSLLILMVNAWNATDPASPAKALGESILNVLRNRSRAFIPERFLSRRPAAHRFAVHKDGAA